MAEEKDKKVDEKVDEKTDAKADAKPETKAESKADAKPKAEDAAAKKAEPKDAAPKKDAPKKEAPAKAESEKAASSKAEPKKADAAEAESDDDAANDEPKKTAKPAGKKASTRKKSGKNAEPAAPAEPMVIRATARYVRSAPRKVRLVIDHIRGESVEEARVFLQFTPRHAARDVSKVLESAIANAEHNHELDGDDLHVVKAYVDEGPTLKRWRPRAKGRATQILKRTSHITVVVSNVTANELKKHSLKKHGKAAA